MANTKEETLSDFIEEDTFVGKPEDKEEAKKSGELFSIPVNKVKEFIKIISDEFMLRFYGSKFLDKEFSEFLNFVKQKAGPKLIKK